MSSCNRCAELEAQAKTVHAANDDLVSRHLKNRAEIASITERVSSVEHENAQLRATLGLIAKADSSYGWPPEMAQLALKARQDASVSAPKTDIPAPIGQSVTVTNQVSNEGQEVHFNHPRLGIRCACPKCVASNGVSDD